MGRSLITVVMPDLDMVIAKRRDKGPAGIMAVEARCLMGRAKVPPMCRGPSARSASGSGIGLVCWAGI